MSNDEILTVKETAALLKTTRQQVRKMIANEELPAFWSVGCLTPALPAFFGFWVKSGSKRIL